MILKGVSVVPLKNCGMTGTFMMLPLLVMMNRFKHTKLYLGLVVLSLEKFYSAIHTNTLFST
jgi:hypothetical protein